MQLHEIMSSKFKSYSKEHLRTLIIALSPCDDDGLDWFDNYDGDDIWTDAPIEYLSWLASPFLRKADLSDAELKYTQLFNADLRKANLSNANLGSADLVNADLRKADLSNAFLFNADLSDANLRHANLSSADLRHADLRKADLSKANLSNARYSSATLLPDGFDPSAAGMILVD